MRKLFLTIALALTAIAVGAQQKPEDKDWAKFYRYEAQNGPMKNRPVAVLMGDSITDGWAKQDGAWLWHRLLVGRGISGQTTAQMLVRFRADVIELDPEYVVILAGINDIARNNGFIRLKNVNKNIISMVELAQAHGIKPVLCTLLPAHEIGWRKWLGDPRPQIDSLNTMIRTYAAENCIPLVDYHTAMKDEEGAMKEEYRKDAVHPNLAGYKVMEAELMRVLDSVRDAAPSGEMYILTPPAPKTPKVNGAKVYGARPKAPFLYRIPATGERPMRFSAEGLPKGLKLDPETGIITGSVKKAGTWKVTLRAENALGKGERELRIVIGDKICLTPPLGWNSWNVWGNSVSQEKVLASARAMVSSGLADCGWTYINIDDGWQGVRGGKYNGIQPNSKFPDMQALADEIHAMGLKFGIYSGPWVGTYAGHIGSSADYADGTYEIIRKGLVDDYYKVDRSRADRTSVRYFGPYSFAAADAKQWAEWGVDYLKYDWYPNDVPHTREMAEALRATGRDIVLSLSNAAPYAQASSWEELSQAWRTTDDIRDNWVSMSTIGFQKQAAWARYCGPGHWPDADMLVVGKVGWGPNVRPTRLTADEQYTHISLWALLSSPLLIGCDMADMDAFTVGLLSNTEVLDVSQDPLGIQGMAVKKDENHAIYLKPLEDGSVAVGLFNLSTSPLRLGFKPRSLGIEGTLTVRDLWRQKDLDTIDTKDRWETTVPGHGVVLLTLRPCTQP